MANMTDYPLKFWTTYPNRLLVSAYDAKNEWANFSRDYPGFIIRLLWRAHTPEKTATTAKTNLCHAHERR